MTILPRSGVKVATTSMPGAETVQPRGSIGLVLAEFDDGFSRRVLQGVLDEAMQSGRPYLVSLAYSHARPELEAAQIRALVESQVEGIIIFPAHERANEAVYLWANGQCPVVFCDRRSENLDFPYARHDNYQGGYASALHLLRDAHHGAEPEDRGRVRRLYTMSGPMVSTLRERLEGVGRAFHEWAGRFPKFEWALRVLEPVRPDQEEDELAEELVTRMLYDVWPNWEAGKSLDQFSLDEQGEMRKALQAVAVLGLHERIALPAFDYLLSLGVRVPTDLIFMSYDDVGSRARGITSVRQLPRELGADAVRLLFDRIAGKPRDRRKEIPRPIQIIPRASTGATDRGKRT